MLLLHVWVLSFMSLGKHLVEKKFYLKKKVSNYGESKIKTAQGQRTDLTFQEAIIILCSI